MIPIYEPHFFGNEKKYLKECIDTNWVSSQGAFIKKFEGLISKYHNTKYAIATSNCTTGLHLAIKSLSIGPGDEVICPDLTFISPANMIALSGANLVLVDIHPETLTINPEFIEDKITDKTKAIMVVHQFGHAAHMDEIMAIASKYGLKIIEDNAESIGGKYKNKLLGTFGEISVFSFFGNKIITTGEGGAILTDDKNIAIKCRELRDHGMSIEKKYSHTDLGYNYRMTNMQAALGVAQMEKLDQILDLRTAQMEYYYDQLSDFKPISLRRFYKWCDPVHWLTTISLKEGYSRDDLILFMKLKGIDTRQMINPVHKAKHFYEKFKKNKFEFSSKISNTSLHLPSGLGLKRREIDYIVKSLKEFFNT